MANFTRRAGALFFRMLARSGLPTQPFFRALHLFALRGRGFGVATVGQTGEEAVLLRASSMHREVGVIFDIGANVGSWSRIAAQMWPSAQIHAFEPSLATYPGLVAGTSDLRITTNRMAVSDNLGEVTLHAAPGQSGLSSLVKRDLDQFGVQMSLEETVTTTTVDEYSRSLGIDRIGYLKVDVEGHELAALRGASSMIGAGKIDFIQFEFGGTHIDSRTFLRDFVRLLVPHYRIYRILENGVELLSYREREEIFMASNFVAVREGLAF